MIHRRQLVIGLILCGILALAACEASSVTIPPRPQRIVSLKPNLTEMLFVLGAGDRVVGVTSYCLWPEAATQKPKVGGYAFPDLERILALQPDLVLTNKESTTQRFVSLIEGAGIPVLILETRTLSQVYDTIERLGAVLGVPTQSHALRVSIRNTLKQIRNDTQERRASKTLIVIQRRPLIVVGKNNFIHEILENSGARNVVPFQRTPYPQISMEEVLAWQPEVILDLDPSSAMKTWTPYSSLPAVKNNRIYFLSPDLFRPGPRIAQTAELIAKVLYPTDPSNP